MAGRKNAKSYPGEGGRIFFDAGVRRKFFARLALTLALLATVAVTTGGGLGAYAAISLTGISLDPSTALYGDYITATADGLDENIYNGWVDVNGNPLTGTPLTYRTGNNWQCQAFSVPETSDLNGFWIRASDLFDPNSTVSQARVFNYSSSTTVGAEVVQFPVDMGTLVFAHDYNHTTLQADTKYWACFLWAGANDVGFDVDGKGLGYEWWDGVTDPETTLTTGTERSDTEGTLSLGIYTITYNPTQLTVIATDGNYTTDYLCQSDFSDANENAFCAFPSPCSAGTCTVKGRLYSVGSGYSGEAQATITWGSQGGSSDLNTLAIPIYVTASSVFANPLYGLDNLRLHNAYSFSAYPGGQYVGKIQIDGELYNTCNGSRDCLQVVDTGVHSWTLYSTLGSMKYTGTFIRDINSSEVNIYVPITYNIFDVYSDLEKSSYLGCSSIYSVKKGFTTGTYGRISTFVAAEGGDYGFDSNSVVPRNCYGEFSLQQMKSYALPEPLSIIFSDDTPTTNTGDYTWDEIVSLLLGREIGEASNDVWFFASPSSMWGYPQNTDGFINLYELYEDSTAHQATVKKYKTGLESGREADDYFSPLPDFDNPNMNDDTSRNDLIDANYYPGNLAIGDNIYCEARLQSHGFIVNDVNILLIANDSTIIGQYAFHPYKVFNYGMSGNTADSVGNLVFHKFADVDPGAAATIRCAFLVFTNLNLGSGWVYSKSRVMYPARTTATGGAYITVADEDGTVSQLRHQSLVTGDENYIDVVYHDFGDLFVGYASKDSPFTLKAGSAAAFVQDRNATSSTWIASKLFYSNLGGTLNIKLYLPDTDASDQSPVIRTASVKQNTDKATIKCSVSFYDKDLDVNKVYFTFWTDSAGSQESPSCFDGGRIYTTNCSNEESVSEVISQTKCLATRYQKYTSIGYYSECGSDNDCSAEVSFNYSNCANYNSTFGYCQVEVEDSNGNSSYYTSSTPLFRQQYTPVANCALFNTGNDEEQKAAVFSGDPSYLLCSLIVNEVLNPNSYDYNVTFLGKSVPYWRHDYSTSSGRTTLYYRLDTTSILPPFMQENGYVNTEIAPASMKVWDKGIDVFFNSGIYGNFVSRVSTVIFSGSDPTSGSSGEGISEENIDQLYSQIDDLTTQFFTDPFQAIKDNFFIFLVLLLLAIVFGGLFIIASVAEYKKRQGG